MNNEDDNWLPLESNPQVMTKFLKQLGLNTNNYAVHDLFSIEQWAQQMLPKPILGVVFLYQINKAQKEHAKQQQQNIKNNVSQNVFFMKQHAKNACGTIALFHIIMNQLHRYPDLVSEDSFFTNFLIETIEKNPQQRGQFFQKNKGLKAQHKKSVKQGQTEVRQKVETHFIAFIEKDGHLYELDGRKKSPINHGQCNLQGLVSGSCVVIQQFMNRDPTNDKFTVLALCSKQ